MAIEFQYYCAIMIAAPLLIHPSRARQYALLCALVAGSFLTADPRFVTYWLPLFALGFVIFLHRHKYIPSYQLYMWAGIFLGICVWRIGPAEALAGLFALLFIGLPIRRPVRILSFLGAISYSLYLVHLPIGAKLTNLWARTGFGGPPVAFVVSLFASLAAAWLLWALVEKPSMIAATNVRRKPAWERGRALAGSDDLR